MPRLNQSGIAAQLLILLLLIAGIGAGVYLVQKEGFQLFKPKATSDKIEWVSSQQDPDNCVEEGGKTTTCPKVKFKITVPQQVSN